MPRNGGQWAALLRSRVASPVAGLDLPALLGDPDAVTRLFAAAVVWERTGRRWPAEALPAVAEAIRTGGHRGRVYACQLLSAMGPSAGDIVPLVWDLLFVPDPTMRAAAAYALCKCCPDRWVLTEARRALEGDEDYVTRYVAEKLREAGG